MWFGKTNCQRMSKTFPNISFSLPTYRHQCPVPNSACLTRKAKDECWFLQGAFHELCEIPQVAIPGVRSEMLASNGWAGFHQLPSIPEILKMLHVMLNTSHERLYQTFQQCKKSGQKCPHPHPMALLLHISTINIIQSHYIDYHLLQISFLISTDTAAVQLII